MARKFLTPIDLNKLELQNAAFQNLGIPPNTPSTGQFYYDTSTSPKQLKVWDGTAWVAVGSSEEEIEDIVAGLIAAGAGISVSYNDGGNTLTIANTGVTSVSGTENEVTVSASAGAVTISLPNTINADLNGTAASATYAVNSASATFATNAASATYATTAGTANSVAANSVALGTDTTGNYVATITGTANEIEVSGSGSEGAAVTIGLPNDVTITNNLTVNGALTVSGSATYVNTEIVTINDNIVLLNSNATGSASQNAGIEVERGDDPNVSFLWNEGSDTWTITNDGTNYHSLTRKFSANVGNSASVSFNIDHNLGTRDVQVQIYDNATYDTVEADVTRPTTNRVTVAFATAPSTDAYRVVIVG